MAFVRPAWCGDDGAARVPRRGRGNILWPVLTANGVPHLLVVVDGDQPATKIQVTGFVADGLVAGDAASFEKSGSGCVLTNVATHALIRGQWLRKR
jgi:hypothetical protein